MRITQGTFSYLPELTDEEITSQLGYALRQGWALSVESTGDPHPRNHYWDMWGLPMFDLPEMGPEIGPEMGPEMGPEIGRAAACVLHEINECRRAHPDRYIRVCAYDSRQHRQTVALSFLVNRPADEPGFRLDRQEGPDRRLRYTIHPYALDRPPGTRYSP
jgi:ribulose-bisphosphate carboxylase small chain